MTKREIFECDLTGEIYGSYNAGGGVLEIEIKRMMNCSPYEMFSEKVHISINELMERIDGMIPYEIEYIGINQSGSIEGAKIGHDFIYVGNEKLKPYDQFLNLIQEEIVY